jgi:hypothetical protein
MQVNIALGVTTPRHVLHLQEHCGPLPTEVLVTVLGYVDLQQRIGSCSAVCRAWRNAAAAAAPDINITLKRGSRFYGDTDPSQRRSLQAWIKRHGMHVTALHVTAAHVANESDELPTRPQLQLACRKLPQLQQLSAANVVLLPDETLCSYQMKQQA